MDQSLILARCLLLEALVQIEGDEEIIPFDQNNRLQNIIEEKLSLDDKSLNRQTIEALFHFLKMNVDDVQQ